MLVLTRRAGQRIFIGDDIVVMLAECGPSHARIGIEAPTAVPIRREELADVAGVRSLQADVPDNVRFWIDRADKLCDDKQHLLNMLDEKGRENRRLRGVANVLADRLAHYTGGTTPGEIRQAEQAVRWEDLQHDPAAPRAATAPHAIAS